MEINVDYLLNGLYILSIQFMDAEIREKIIIKHN